MSLPGGLRVQRLPSRLAFCRVPANGLQTGGQTETQIQIHYPRRAERPHLQVRAGTSHGSLNVCVPVSYTCRSVSSDAFRAADIKPEETTILFVTKCPCDECVPLIKGAGISHIYTTDQDRDKDKRDISYLRFSGLKDISKFIVSTWREG